MTGAEEDWVARDAAVVWPGAWVEERDGLDVVTTVGALTARLS